MMLAMPYITKNLDPEVLQEAQQNQARVRNVIQGGDMKSSLPPVTGNGETRTAVTTATSSLSGANNVVKNRGKKRRGH